MTITVKRLCSVCCDAMRASNSASAEAIDAVMHQQLLPTGRVSYFPMSEYLGDGRIRTLGGDDVDVAARRIVDSTFVGITVPSMRRPPYEVAPGSTAYRRTICPAAPPTTGT